MNTATVKTQSKTRTAYQEVLKFKEEFEMRLAMRISQVNMRIHQVLSTKTQVKLLGGLALGALVMTAAVLPFALGVAHSDDPTRPLSIEEMGGLPQFLQTEVWLPGDTYPMAVYSSKVTKAESEDLPAFLQTEVWLPGDAYPVQARDLPGFLQTEVWLPGDTYPVSDSGHPTAKAQAENLPGFLQTEVWLPGDTYPVFGR